MEKVEWICRVAYWYPAWSFGNAAVDKLFYLVDLGYGGNGLRTDIKKWHY